MLDSFSIEAESPSETLSRPITLEERENIVAMKSRGISDNNISAALGINRQTVSVVVAQEKVIVQKKVQRTKPREKKIPEQKPDVAWQPPNMLGENWVTEGLCRNGGFDPDFWFPAPEDATVRNLAQKICYRCPVIIQCRNAAMERGETHGIWGATTEAQRKRLRRAARNRQDVDDE